MADPVAFGIVTNIARPGGNITGVSIEAGPEIWGKRVQVLREAVPTAAKVGFLGSSQIWSLPEWPSAISQWRRFLIFSHPKPAPRIGLPLPTL
jgi:ABC transporter substrate binding protein